MGEAGPRGPYGLPVSSLSRARSPSACIDDLVLAWLTHPLRGTLITLEEQRSTH